VKTLAPGAVEGPDVFGLQDRLVYVLSGTAQIRLGSLVGPLVEHQYQYIPATVRHEVRNCGYAPLKYLSLIITDPDTAQGTELHVQND
jgi:mannose-6-phosphate isomerase-like protein (cupin superfamily)